MAKPEKLGVTDMNPAAPGPAITSHSEWPVMGIGADEDKGTRDGGWDGGCFRLVLDDFFDADGRPAFFDLRSIIIINIRSLLRNSNNQYKPR